MRVYPVRPRERAALSVLIALVLVCTGCSWFTRGDGLAGITAIPLTPALRLSPSITSAAIPYQNACGQQASISIAAPLTETLPKKLGRIFTGLSTDAGTGQGVIEAALGLKQIDLAITRQVKRTYPVTVILGLDMTFLADDGTPLFSKKLQSAGHGEVEVTDQSCDVKGLDSVVREAVGLVSEGMAKQISESIRVREFAERRKAGMLAAPAAGSLSAGAPPARVPPPSTPNEAPPNVSQAAPILPQKQVSIAGGAAEATALIFRAIVRDENRDQILQQEESLTIEVEVKNDGVQEAKGVEVVVSGTPALTAQFPPVLVIGDLQPGEVKRTTSTKRASAVKEPLRGEVVLSLRSATPIVSIPLAKKFTMLIKPEKAEAAEPVPDVDQPPKTSMSKPPKTVVIAIGVGRFRDEQVPSVKYAGRDAEVMASSLRAIGNVPDDRVRVLVDGQALKQDLAETFDEWLPKRADSNTVAYVFFAGRALVDGVTGAVSLVPFDGTTTAVNRLYSVRRLQESLSRALIHRAILMFDVSLEPTPGSDPSTSALPNWEAGAGERRDQIMWMVSHHGLQESHAYEQGRHGLFTYYLLRGLQGLADVDRDGTVVAGELCTYARGQVSRLAREQFGNEQDPLCLPPPGQGAMVRIHPLAKGNNPKPASAIKKQEPAESPSSRPKPSELGPGQ